jgi:hypothetical protein
MSSRLNTQDEAEARRFGYSDESWGRLSEREKELLRLIQPAPQARYKVNVNIARLEDFLKDQEDTARRMGGQFSLQPDFQRGHVWDEPRQQAYVENFLRRNASALFRFNCPAAAGVPRTTQGDVNPYDFVCIDGLQRLTALIKYQHGDLQVFGGLTVDDMKDTDFDTKRFGITSEIEVFDFHWREELLDYYIALNSGGVVHAEAEIDRVKALRDQAHDTRKSQQTATAPAPKKAPARRSRPRSP